MVCFGVTILDQYGSLVDARNQRAYISDAEAAAASKALVAAPGIGLLARSFVRKNSQKRIEEAYTFAASAPLGTGAFGVVRRAVHNETATFLALDSSGSGR